MKLIWASDIHLNHVPLDNIRKIFFDEINTSEADALVITGDISDGKKFKSDFNELKNNINMDIYFVLGNHDFYHSGFSKVRNEMKSYGKNYLGNASIIELSKTTAMIGHDGWYDIRNGTPNKILLNDFFYIEELQKAYMYGSISELTEAVQKNAKISSDYFRSILNKVFLKYDEVILATHVPPFANIVDKGDSNNSNEYFLPYYSSKEAGQVLLDVMIKFKNKQLTVLCGHTHRKAKYKPLNNLEVFCASASYGTPEIQDQLFIIEDGKHVARN